MWLGCNEDSEEAKEQLLPCLDWAMSHMSAVVWTFDQVCVARQQHARGPRTAQWLPVPSSINQH